MNKRSKFGNLSLKPIKCSKHKTEKKTQISDNSWKCLQTGLILFFKFRNVLILSGIFCHTWIYLSWPLSCQTLVHISGSLTRILQLTEQYVYLEHCYWICLASNLNMTIAQNSKYYECTTINHFPFGNPWSKTSMP